MLVGALALGGCAVPYAQIDAGYQGLARTKDETFSRMWYAVCRRDSVEQFFERFGATTELWNSALTTCGYAGRPQPLPRPDLVVRPIEESLEPDFVDEPGEAISGRRTPDDGGPIDFGLIE